MQNVKCNFSPRFAIKLNKYAYRTTVIHKICIYGKKFIKMKIDIRSYCYVNTSYYFNIKLRENYMVKEMFDDTIVFWRPLRCRIR